MQRFLAVFFLTIFLIPILVTATQFFNGSPQYNTDLIDFMPESDEESGEKENKEKEKDSKEDSDKLFFDNEHTSGQLLNAISLRTILLKKHYDYNLEIPVPPPQSFQS